MQWSAFQKQTNLFYLILSEISNWLPRCVCIHKSTDSDKWADGKKRVSLTSHVITNMKMSTWIHNSSKWNFNFCSAFIIHWRKQTEPEGDLWVVIFLKPERFLTFRSKHAGQTKSWCPTGWWTRLSWAIISVISIFFKGTFLVADSRLYLAVSARPPVGLSVHFWIASVFRITAPAQPSATGLPCIRPCLSRVGRYFKIISGNVAVYLPKSTSLSNSRNALWLKAFRYM